MIAQPGRIHERRVSGHDLSSGSELASDRLRSRAVSDVFIDPGFSRWGFFLVAPLRYAPAFGRVVQVSFRTLDGTTKLMP
jgi:hypothetical protein